ncbi:MAG: hypothetical protein HY717_03145 [Planctomycetes bacterium]|nr:hypothetical protein [Planctomycetota bacterium]
MELFLGRNGELVSERPLALGYEAVCPQSKLANTAYGMALGFSPAPDDIYASAAGAASQGFHPLTGVMIRNQEVKRQITFTDGTYELAVTSPVGHFYLELTHGVCASDRDRGDFVKPMISVSRPDFFSNKDCDQSVPVVDEAVNTDVAQPIDFDLNPNIDPERTFELMAYHHTQRFFDHARELMDQHGIEHQEFPLTVALRWEVRDIDTKAFYFPLEWSSRICISKMKRLDAWYPATIIQHEYAHHQIHSMTGSREGGHIVEGLADALTAYFNGNHRIGYLSDTDPGGFGFSLRDAVEDMHPPEMLFHRLRGTVGKIFWDIRQKFNSQLEAEILFYRWLTFHHTNDPAARTFELSFAMLEELLAMDDLTGPNEFRDADNDIRNGTPHIKQIVPAFESLLKEVKYLRGDVDGSGEADVSDAIGILIFLFVDGKLPKCLSAFDADDSGAVDITDPIALLNFLFLGGEPPPAPFSACGAVEGNKLWCKESNCPGQ